MAIIQIYELRQATLMLNLQQVYFHTAPEPNATSSNSYYNSSLALKDGYAEIQVNVGNANIPSSFNNISYVEFIRRTIIIILTIST